MNVATIVPPRGDTSVRKTRHARVHQDPLTTQLRLPKTLHQACG